MTPTTSCGMRSSIRTGARRRMRRSDGRPSLPRSPAGGAGGAGGRFHAPRSGCAGPRFRVLDGLAPGPVLAGFTADATAGGFGRLSDDELIGVLCARRRLASWAAAGGGDVVGGLARRRTVPAEG